jgi:hypothetical protein
VPRPILGANTHDPYATANGLANDCDANDEPNQRAVAKTHVHTDSDADWHSYHRDPTDALPHDGSPYAQSGTTHDPAADYVHANDGRALVPAVNGHADARANDEFPHAVRSFIYLFSLLAPRVPPTPLCTFLHLRALQLHTCLPHPYFITASLHPHPRVVHVVHNLVSHPCISDACILVTPSCLER